MSWFGTSDVETQLLKATSSSIPSGEQDLPLNLEISDLVRSKQAAPKDVLRTLRKRLYDRNPNVQILTLHLLDLLVKNGGLHFFDELAKKEFIDAYVAQLSTLRNQNRNPEVVELMLEYFQSWAIASKSRAESKYLQDKYAELKKQRDIEFPEVETIGEISSSFIESATAPEWIDSDTCMKSGEPFTFYNRKHHCRNCGGVFLQEYCSNFRPLPHFGINIPVRVCVDCEEKLQSKSETSNGSRAARVARLPASKGLTSNNRDISSKYRDDLEEAIRLSMEASQAQNRPVLSMNAHNSAPNKADDNDEMDEDMRRAIEASLAEIKQGPINAGFTGANSQTYPNTLNGKRSAAVDGSSFSEPESQQRRKLVPDIPSDETDMVEAFSRIVATADPRGAIYNSKLTEMNRSAIGLQPKVISELRLVTSKLGSLEDLHGKLSAVTSYYDRILEAVLDPDAARAQRAAAAHGASVARPAHDETQDLGNAEGDVDLLQEHDQTPGRALEEGSPDLQATDDSTARPDWTPEVSSPAYVGSKTRHAPESVSNATTHKAAAPSSYDEGAQESEPEAEAESESEPEPEPVLIEL